MTKIGLDIDGVLLDIIPAFNQAAELFGKTPNWKRYDGGFKPDEWKLIHDCAFNSFVENCQPYPEAVEVLRRWAKFNELTYITSRCSQQGSPYIQSEIERLTKSQMKRWFPPGEVIFTQDKVKVVREREIDLMVEDYLINAKKINQFVHCFLIDRPWNRGELYPLRVYSLKDVPMGGW